MFKSLKPFVVAISLLLTMTQISCNSDDDSDCRNTICTTEFVTITVFVKDQDQQPVALDSFKVINIENGTDMTISLSQSELEMSQQSGQYPLVNDGSLEANEKRQIQFKGFINNQEVISSSYTVSDDCCHIDVITGNLQLTL